MKLLLKILISIILIFALIMGGFMFYMTRGLEEGARQVINQVDLTTLEDGSYNGSYNSGRWTNEVSVTVKDQKITKIELLKDVTFSKPEETQKIFNKVIEEQNVDIDAMSGATVTGKAYLKSIENALLNGKQ